MSDKVERQEQTGAPAVYESSGAAASMLLDGYDFDEAQCSAPQTADAETAGEPSLSAPEEVVSLQEGSAAGDTALSVPESTDAAVSEGAAPAAEAAAVFEAERGSQLTVSAAELEVNTIDTAEADTPEAETSQPGAPSPDGTAPDGAALENGALGFESFGLPPELLQAVKDLGYESPTPIQERALPQMLEGRDIIGQAQTGTGKTAAFALPILAHIDCSVPVVQALVLEPTRELALQVAEACQSLARYLDGFRVAPIYGGASYENQLRSLRRGVQIVVGTPGRLIDLIKQGRLDLGRVHCLVIDEADEMLRMGFIEDVEWILSNTPEQRQNALFSATMPPAIVKIARDHLKDPVEVRIESRITPATTVHQRYWVASGAHKIDAMTRILEVEPYEAVLVFVRTKTDAEDVANKLMARGLACAALHGDIPQRQREKIVERLRNGSLDIIIATDVAARGLDVDRITHVFNYDIPYDAESYVHRIGRTGRAGRTGEAILFVSPRERRALRQIERITHQKIEPMRMPSAADVNRVRLENFKNQVLEVIAQGDLDQYQEVISELLADSSVEPETLAAALAKMYRGNGALLLDESEPEPRMRSFDEKGRGEQAERRRHGPPSAEPVPLRAFPDMKMQRYRLAVGRRDGARPGQIVGAIANEGNIESKYIGEISIFDSFTTVDLPEGMPAETMRILASARVCGRPLELRVYTAEPRRRRNNFAENAGGSRSCRDGDTGTNFDKGSRHSRFGSGSMSPERPRMRFEHRPGIRRSGSRGGYRN